MKKNTTPEMYIPATLMALGFVHQYDRIENEDPNNEFSYSVFKLDLNEEFYLECTLEYGADKLPRKQYFQFCEFDINKPTTGHILILKKLFNT